MCLLTRILVIVVAVSFGCSNVHAESIKALSSPVYAPWNGFLGMTNVLELVNTENTEKRVWVTFYDIDGNAEAPIPIKLSARGQYDLILNSLSAFRENSYGIVQIEFDGTELGGRLSFYRSGFAGNGDDYEFAFSMPLQNALSGDSYVGFNTYQPSRAAGDANNLVTNWLAIVNLSSDAGGKTFSVTRYGVGGGAIRTERVKVPAFGRVDIDGGHGEGPGVVGYSEVLPDDSLAPYLAQVTRYGLNAPRGALPTGYSFAFPLSAKKGGPTEQWAPISAGAGAQNWVEMINVSDSRATLSAHLFDNAGRDITPEAYRSFSLAPHSQVHINATAQLNGASGAVRVVSETAGTIVGQSMFYFYDPASSRIQAMYGSPFEAAGSGGYVGSWNLFLGMYNWLRIFNTGDSSSEVLVTVYNSGRATYDLLTLGRKKGIDLDLHNHTKYGTSTNSYGLVRVEGDNLRSEILRHKPTSTGSTDFAAPISLISTRTPGETLRPNEVCYRPLDLSDTSSPDRVVGTGTAASCTEAAFAAAVAAGGIITFDCGADPHTITLTSEKVVGRDTTIDGNNLITLSGAGTTRILNMDSGNFEATGPHLKLQRLRFVNGRAIGTLGRLGYNIDGGGAAVFYRGGSVTAVDCQFVGNVGADYGPDVGGGAIYGVGVGRTTVVGCQFEGNRASNGGAIGALHTELIIANSTFVNNTATGSGANYVDEHGQQQGSGGNGGAIVMDGRDRTLSICGSTIQGSSAGAHGGAIFRTGYASEPTIIDRTTFDSNGVRDNADSDAPSSGGALYIQGTSVTITDSTISNNAARAFAGVWILGHGSSAPGVANLTNVTITGNYTYPRDPFTNRGIGAGLVIGSNTTGTIQNCTIVDNHAQFGSGILNASPLTINNSIIANDYDNEWTPLNCTGSSYSSWPANGLNNIQWPNGLSNDMDCVNGISRVDPLMGQLRDNGGPVNTIAPQGGSPALRAGTSCPSTDARGEPRSNACTLGAYESP
jgi:hypothetical protein